MIDPTDLLAEVAAALDGWTAEGAARYGIRAHAPGWAIVTPDSFVEQVHEYRTARAEQALRAAGAVTVRTIAEVQVVAKVNRVKRVVPAVLASWPMLPEPDRRVIALFSLPDRSTVQVLETQSDGYRLACCPLGAELDPDGSRYFGSAGAAIAAAVELAEIDLPTPTQEDQPHE